MTYDLTALRDGSADAFADVYEAKFSFVYRCCLSYCRQPELAEEATVDVFVRLHRIRNRVDPSRPLDPLLAKIARDTIFSYLKRIAKDDRMKLEFINTFTGPVAELDSEHIYVAGELEIQVKEIVTRLPPRCRRVFALHHFHGTENQEIAKLLLISPHTVKAQLAKARRLLRYELRNWMSLFLL